MRKKEDPEQQRLDPSICRRRDFLERLGAASGVGMCSHLGGLNLAQLRMMERMATHMGDEPYAMQYRRWLVSRNI